MQHPSNDRARPNERTEAPAFPELGASLPSGADERLRRLVHDLANWYQRIEAQLERLEEGNAPVTELLAGVRANLQACAQLGAAAAGTALPAATVPGLLLEFAARDAASRSGGEAPLRVESADASSGGAPGMRLALAAAEFENILLNLVENARRAGGPPREPVLLRWALEPDGAWVEVVDAGEGMDSATIERCLRGGYSTKGEAGHGLGLSGTRRTVESVGGRLEIESRLGSGTTVRLRLPAHDAGALRPAPGHPSPVGAFRSALLVEDDADVAEVVRLFLESSGLSCTVCGSGRGAWAALAESTFDVALIDQGLPDLPGLDLAEGIRQEHPNLVVVLLTGDPSVRRHAVPEGPLDAVGLKPLDRAGIHALLEEAADHARLRATQDAPRRRPAQG